MGTAFGFENPKSALSDKPPPIELHFLNLLKHSHQLGTKDQIYESIGVIFSYILPFFDF